MDELIKEIKENFLSLLDKDPYSLVSPCPYEIAWVAMIPHPNRPSEPMFGSCLNWVLNNQTEHEFWGNCNSGSEKPTLDCLTATLACIVALKKWNICSDVISKGLEFMDSSNAKKLLKEVEDHGCPRWFAIVFPRMVELAEEVLKIKILKDDQVRNILFKARKNIFET
ncbi:hypothetical protein F8388_000496 [Cannabis sativa]|nr:hypothetical protein F8388_000496 [Cannabis sativa]KAF4394068.1 hypothetical protein G4B88_026037 [Cannabis sativa]